MLICPVRGCGLPLVREPGRVVCGRGHSFDAARSGYINLLQPQDRRSKQPGDSAAAVAARRRLHDRGVTQPLLEAIVEMASPRAGEVALDAGCGGGFYLGSLAERFDLDGHGVDISTPAVDAAARRYKRCEWIVANADRSLPYSEASFSLILSITGRRNAAEFRRVLRNNGRLLAAVPSPQDLIELRGTGRDRVPGMVEEFAPHFKLDRQRRVTTSADLDAEAVEDLRLSIYRPVGPRAPEPMRVTLSLDLLLFRPA